MAVHIFFIYCVTVSTVVFCRLCYIGYAPSSHIVAVPVGVDDDLTDGHVLLATLLVVDVVVAQDDTPSSRAETHSETHR